MKKLIATALIAFSALSAIAAVAHADYFGTSKQTQEGQLLPVPSVTSRSRASNADLSFE